MSEVVAYVDTGHRETLDEGHKYCGSLWLTDDGTLKVNIGPDTSYTMDADNSLTVWHDGRKAW